MADTEKIFYAASCYMRRFGKNMKVFIVYCHPSEDSFTRHIRDSFIKGIVDSGNEYILSDLYKMNFNSDISERQYLRDVSFPVVPFDIAFPTCL